MKWLWSEHLNKAMDTISKVAQIVALVCAGRWAYTTYYESVGPGLGFRGNVSTVLNWSDASEPSNCRGVLTATVVNEGINSFDVSKVTMQGWFYNTDQKARSANEAPLAAPSATKPVYIDLQHIQDKNHLFDQKTYNKVNELKGAKHEFQLTETYPPGVKMIQSWEYLFKRVPGQVVLFKVDVTASDSKGNKPIPTAWISEDTCPLPSETKSAKTRP